MKLAIICSVILVYISSTNAILCRRDDCKRMTITAKAITCKSKESCIATDMTSSSYIDCAGIGSCTSATATAKGDIACVAKEACSKASITSTGGDISCDGAYGCMKAAVSADGDVYCNGIKSCYGDGYSISAGNNVYIPRYLGAYHANPVVADGDIIITADRYGAVFSTLIAKNINALGENAARLSSLIAKQNVMCTGDFACMYSTVATSTEKLYIELDGKGAGMGVWIYCPSGGRCEVNCIRGCQSETDDSTMIYYTSDTNLIVTPSECTDDDPPTGKKGNCPELMLQTEAEMEELMKTERVYPESAFVDIKYNEDFADFEAFVTISQPGLYGVFGSGSYIISCLVVVSVLAMIIACRYCNKQTKPETYSFE